jgi:hypothetical protein
MERTPSSFNISDIPHRWNGIGAAKAMRKTEGKQPGNPTHPLVRAANDQG